MLEFVHRQIHKQTLRFIIDRVYNISLGKEKVELIFININCDLNWKKSSVLSSAFWNLKNKIMLKTI